MSEDDYCVYARNILSRLNGGPNPTSSFTEAYNETVATATSSNPT